MHSFHSDREHGTSKLQDTDSHDFEGRDASLDEPILNVGGHGGTQRRLRNYQVTMIGFASGIGTGLFVGTGSAYASSGPAGLLLAYIIIGAILWCVMQSIAELATVVSWYTTSKVSGCYAECENSILQLVHSHTGRLALSILVLVSA